MPHVIVEYSANLAGPVDVKGLLAALHQAALETGVFPAGGIRTRAERRDEYIIADGRPEAGFVHVMLRIGAGRDLPTKKRAADHVFAVLCNALAPVQAQRPLAISLEVQELDPVLNLKKNNLHAYLAADKAKETA
ncbi:MAG: 5-carboxymethyl-2-hydroxymuconate Delta-isomerase [Rhodospirillaceae bacterium]|nr:5-carboxymethyl-2-hydroxymuconate Delta-isomerase [Rhodospirillaceae bacterium]